MLIDNELAYQFEYLGFEKILPHIVCVREWAIIHEQQLTNSAINVLQDIIDQNLLPVINLSGNPTVVETFLSKLLKYFDSNQFFLLVPDIEQAHDNQINTAHWPFCLVLQQAANTDYRTVFKKKYRISALMRQTRLHRLMLLEKIKPWVIDKDVVVANAVIDGNVPLDVKESAEAMTWLDQLPWANQQDFYDLGNNNLPFTYTNIDHPAYQACVNITNESWAQDVPIFISEKTWKAYASACMVINYGSSRVPEVLKNLGFAIWEEYDPCLDYQDKVHKIVELFQRDDIEDLYNKNVDMITHNQQLATSWHFARKLAMPAVEKIQALL